MEWTVSFIIDKYAMQALALPKQIVALPTVWAIFVLNIWVKIVAKLLCLDKFFAFNNIVDPNWINNRTITNIIKLKPYPKALTVAGNAITPAPMMFFMIWMTVRKKSVLMVCYLPWYQNISWLRNSVMHFNLHLTNQGVCHLWNYGHRSEIQDYFQSSWGFWSL